MAAFAEAMYAMQQASVEFVTEVTPLNAETAKHEFVNRVELVGAPNFVYDNSTDYKVGERRVGELLQRFQQEGFSEIQMEVLTKLAKNIQAQYGILQAIRNYRLAAERGDSTLAAEEAIHQLTAQLYGEPDERVYRALWMERLQEIERGFSSLEWLEKVPGDIREQLGYLKSRFATDATPLEKPFVPRPETVTRFAEFCRARWQKVFARVKPGRTYTPEEVCDLLNATMAEDFPYPVAWTAEMSENKTSLDTNQIDRKLEIPRYRGKGPYTSEVLTEIMLGHELMVHISRQAYAAAYCPDVAVPLPNYLDFEEGLAKAVEQALAGKFEQAGIDHYLTVGMAYYDHLDFGEIFEIQRDQLFLQDYQLGDTAEKRQAKWQKATNEAFRLALRCFRGTGKVPLTNNLIYYNGQARVWRFIEERIDRLEELEYALFECGKADPTNPLHQRLLTSIGRTVTP